MSNPSSTSSSDERCPGGPWKRTWLAFALLVALPLGAWEAILRAEGHGPSVSDDRDLWAQEAEAALADGDGLVILGASRVQLGLDLQGVRARFPALRPRMLAIDGTHPLASLEELAARGAAGPVLVSLRETSFAPWAWDDQAEHWRHLDEQWGPARRLERRLTTWTQQHLAVCRNDLTLPALLRAVPDGWPEDYLRTGADRSRRAHYARCDLPRHRARRLREEMRDGKPPRAAWEAGLERARRSVERIERRGGRVAFVHFPLDGAVRALHRSRFPKEEWWDRIAPATGALTLHEEEVPGWRDLRCPDHSHLDAQDRARATEALLDALVARGFLDPE